MKLFFKIIGITFISILLVLYFGIIFGAKAIDINKFKPEIQK